MKKQFVKYSHAPVSADSVSMFSVIHGSRGAKNNLKIKEINGS
jgi:hypothetical protein